MNFKVLHISSQRIRARVPISCSLAVQSYMLEIAGECEAIQHIHFYQDSYSIALIIKENKHQEALSFLKKIDIKDIIHCSKYFISDKKESLYGIVSSAVIQRVLFKTLVPYPIQILITVYKSIRYSSMAVLSVMSGNINMDTLDGTAVALSILSKQFNTASSIMFLLELGEKLGTWSQKQSISDLEKSLFNAVDSVWVITSEGPTEKSVNQIEPQDIIWVTEGQEILFDGEIVLGQGSINESSLTGEFFPVLKHVGDQVYSNTVLEKGELHVKIKDNQPNSRISQLISVMKETDAQSDTKHYQFIKTADRLVKYNFLGALLTYIFTHSFSKATSFLLVDYSCALKLSTPVAYLTIIQDLIQRGIVVKSISALDTFRKIDTIVFDKTGTITSSRPQIHSVIPFENYTEQEVLKIAACLEEHIYHPIAQAVVDKAKEEGVLHPEMHSELTHIASKGILSTIDGDIVVIGSRMLMDDYGVIISNQQEKLIQQLETEYNLLYLGYKNKLIAVFCVSVFLRPEVLECLVSLKNQNKELILLTGDTYKRTYNLVGSLPFDKIVTDMTPLSKHSYILNKQLTGKRVIMIGDGLNDSAALVASDLSISMGEGANLTKQVSDIIFSSGSLSSLTVLDEKSNVLERQIKENICLSTSINTSLICLGLLGILQGRTLALLHNLTTFSLIFKSFRRFTD